MDPCNTYTHMHHLFTQEIQVAVERETNRKRNEEEKKLNFMIKVRMVLKAANARVKRENIMATGVGTAAVDAAAAKLEDMLCAEIENKLA